MGQWTGSSASTVEPVSCQSPLVYPVESFKWRLSTMIRGVLKGLLRDDEAATASEYAIMLALIITAVISAVNAVGSSTAGGWSRNVNIISTSLNNGS